MDRKIGVMPISMAPEVPGSLRGHLSPLSVRLLRGQIPGPSSPTQSDRHPNKLRASLEKSTGAPRRQIFLEISPTPLILDCPAVIGDAKVLDLRLEELILSV